MCLTNCPVRPGAPRQVRRWAGWAGVRTEGEPPGAELHLLFLLQSDGVSNTIVWFVIPFQANLS